MGPRYFPVMPCNMYDPDDNEEDTSQSAYTALQKLKTYWGRIWYRERVPVNDGFRSWRANLPPIPPGPAWQPITAQELAGRIPKIKELVAGLCAWTGEELAALPLEALEIFAILVNRWFERESFPLCWQHLRQTHLAKPDMKPRGSDQAVSFNDARPIAVESVWMRLVAGAIYERDAIQLWICAWRPHEAFGGLRGCGVHSAIAVLDQSFQRDGYLMTLDCSKCFDHCDPALSLEALQALGCPRQGIQLCSHTWLHQHRWLQLHNCCLPEPAILEGSLPQGDVWSPVALLALMHGIIANVKASLRSEGIPQPVTAVYLDDRTFVTRSAKLALQVRHAWISAATEIGLQENEAKTKLLCKGAARSRKADEEGAARFLSDSVRVLGVDFVSKATGVVRATAKDRLQEAERRATKIASAHFSWRIQYLLLRWVVIKKACWGVWLSTSAPPL